jgi:hypothetical protein
MKKIITLLATTLTFGIFSQTTGSIVNESGNSIFSYQVDHVNCFGQSNGSIDLTPLTNDSWSYTWNNQENTEDLNNLYSGIYRVTLKNQFGQIYYGSFTIEQPEKLQAFINVENDNLDLVVIGGLESYVYLWNTGDTTEDISVNSSGIYEVIVVDSNNCVVTTNTYASVSTSSLIEYENQSKVYPNPSNGSATIVISSEVKNVEVINSNGQVVFNQNVSGQNSIQLESLSSGVYLCNLISDNDIETLKLVVE